MVTEHPLSKGVYVRLLPLSSLRYDDSGANSLSKPILVQVKRKQDLPQLFLNGKEISREKLRGALKSELSSRPDWFVFVEGDRSLQFDDVMAVVDVVSGLHAKAVLLTARGEPGLRPRLLRPGSLTFDSEDLTPAGLERKR
jgi:biopolymer transport protein ExbD